MRISTHYDVPRTTLPDSNNVTPIECLPPRQLQTQNGELPTCFRVIISIEAKYQKRGSYISSVQLQLTTRLISIRPSSFQGHLSLLQHKTDLRTIRRDFIHDMSRIMHDASSPSLSTFNPAPPTSPVSRQTFPSVSLRPPFGLSPPRPRRSSSNLPTRPPV